MNELTTPQLILLVVAAVTVAMLLYFRVTIARKLQQRDGQNDEKSQSVASIFSYRKLIWIGAVIITALLLAYFYR